MAYQPFNFMNKSSVNNYHPKRSKQISGVVEQFAAGGKSRVIAYVKDNKVYSSDTMNSNTLIGYISNGDAYYSATSQRIGNVIPLKKLESSNYFRNLLKRFFNSL